MEMEKNEKMPRCCDIFVPLFILFIITSIIINNTLINIYCESDEILTGCISSSIDLII